MMSAILFLIMLIPMIVIVLVGSIALLISLFTIVAIIYNTISKNGKTKDAGRNL